MTMTIEQLLIDLEGTTTQEQSAPILNKITALNQIADRKEREEANRLNQIRSYADITKTLEGYDTPFSENKKKIIESEISSIFPELPSPDSYIYLHVDMVDGDGKDPIGVKNDGIDHIAITATFRTGESATSDIITLIDNAEWRVTVRNSEDIIYDVVNIKFTEGVCNFNYTTTNAPAFCTILEKDFEIVTMGDVKYKIILVDEVNFKVYRDFSV